MSEPAVLCKESDTMVGQGVSFLTAIDEIYFFRIVLMYLSFSISYTNENKVLLNTKFEQ